MVKAICVLKGEKVNGTVFFNQEKEGSEVHVTGELSGLSEGLHGFHVHEFGDLTNGCTSAGPHLNVDGCSHGAPSDPKGSRHTGDLGNLTAGTDGIAKVDLKDSFISLCGPNAILGRTMVIHAEKDDLGKGGHELSASTGNAGARSACGVIGMAK
uniref:Superoxide dismutase [Cu-Zn] n=1 Tax=Caligus clemensi TaxID=344056 RepID=C1C2E3_CALCM|nr:Superoxide dismutase [Caligus clemensi]